MKKKCYAVDLRFDLKLWIPVLPLRGEITFTIVWGLNDYRHQPTPTPDGALRNDRFVGRARTRLCINIVAFAGCFPSARLTMLTLGPDSDRARRKFLLHLRHTRASIATLGREIERSFYSSHSRDRQRDLSRSSASRVECKPLIVLKKS